MFRSVQRNNNVSVRKNERNIPFGVDQRLMLLFANSKLWGTKWNESLLYCINRSSVVLLHGTAFDAVRIADLLYRNCIFADYVCCITLLELQIEQYVCCKSAFVLQCVPYTHSFTTIKLQTKQIKQMPSALWSAWCVRRMLVRVHWNLTQCSFHENDLHLGVHDAQFWDSNTAHYNAKLSVKHALREWHMLLIIYRNPQQIHIVRWGLRCCTPWLDSSSNNGMHPILLFRRGYRAMHFIFFMNI